MWEVTRRAFVWGPRGCYGGIGAKGWMENGNFFLVEDLENGENFL